VANGLSEWTPVIYTGTDAWSAILKRFAAASRRRNAENQASHPGRNERRAAPGVQRDSGRPARAHAGAADCLAQKLGEFVRYETTLPPRLSELAILIIARHWTAQFEWTAHKAEALKGGLDPEIIEDIANRRAPRFKNPDEPVVYDFSVSLNQTHAVPDELYQRAVATIGLRGVVELVGILGYYTLISMTLNTFEILPEGTAPELTP
jgi:4-carboxymuconolactone decarboxylase